MTTPKNTETTTQKRSRFAIRLPKNASENSQQQQQPAPRAVVLVFGWAFSHMKHVLKYSELYEERGCATITGILEPRFVAVKNDAAIAKFVCGAMEEASRLVRGLEGPNGKPIPILVHAFCNGGGFCRLGLHQALTTEGGTPNEATKELIRDRLVAEVLDSCPVYISTRTSIAAGKAVVKNPLLFLALWVLGTCANYCKYFWSLLVEGEAFYVTYWNQAKEANVCPHQFIVYSTADAVAEPDRVEEFVDYRKAQSQGSLTVVKFEDTGHCQHLLGHRTEYCALVDAAIERAVREMEDQAKANPRLRSRM